MWTRAICCVWSARWPASNPLVCVCIFLSSFSSHLCLFRWMFSVIFLHSSSFSLHPCLFRCMLVPRGGAIEGERCTTRSKRENPTQCPAAPAKSKQAPSSPSPGFSLPWFSRRGFDPILLSSHRLKDLQLVCTPWLLWTALGRFGNTSESMSKVRRRLWSLFLWSLIEIKQSMILSRSPRPSCHAPRRSARWRRGRERWQRWSLIVNNSQGIFHWCSKTEWHQYRLELFF